ncbi:hypothetical protein O3G_MSEX003728 [Manduca sexta]|uniref:Uncharacterized protein n=1 Tax=Manduca sexta TaxID=7130 RepID=A0A922CGJ6_MANSE|nr:hypothetical protein O3G_MSEX003728 [Manduca sexta]
MALTCPCKMYNPPSDERKKRRDAMCAQKAINYREQKGTGSNLCYMCVQTMGLWGQRHSPRPAVGHGTGRDSYVGIPAAVGKNYPRRRVYDLYMRYSPLHPFN